MHIFIIFLVLISLNIGISFENILDTNESIEEPLLSRTLWSRLKDINPPTTKTSFTKFKPKYIFKGLKERISSDLDDGFVNSETPLNLWSSGNISFKNEVNSESTTEMYPLNHKIDEKFFWNTSEITNNSGENSTYSDSESDNKTLNESEIIFSSSELNPISTINTSTEQNLNLSTVQNTKAILLSPKESELGQNFPIYFTNPATGIVYAIHPVGTSSSSTLPSSQNLQMGSSGHPYTIENFTSQMYVTKEEYERKIQLLKERFRRECNQLRRKIQEHNRKLKTTATTTTTTEASKKFEQKKKIIKHKDPLIVEALDGVLNDVYDQVVDTMTLKVKKSKKKRKNGSTRNKSKKRKDPNITTTPATDQIDDNDDDDEPIVIPAEEKPPEPFIHIWHDPSTSSTTSTPLNLNHNDYNYYDEKDGDDDDKRYTLISSSRPNKKQKFEIQSYSKPVQMSYEKNYESLIPIRLTSSSIVKTKRTKRSIDSKNSQSMQNYLKVNSLNKTETQNNQKNIQNLKEPQKIQKGSAPLIASSSKTTPTPQYSKKSIQHDDYYFDFDDLIYDDYEYADQNYNEPFVETEIEQRNRPSRKNGKKSKDVLPEKKRKRKNTRSEDYAYFDDPGIFSYIEDFVSTIQNTVSSFLPDATELSSLNNDLISVMVDKDDEKSKLPKPSSNDENVTEDQHENPTEDNTGIGSWFSSWFGSDDDPENTENQITETTEEPGWFESIFGTEEKSSDVSAESEDDSGQWLFGWFDSDTKKKKQKKKTVTTTPTPILTVTDQLINPQKWIGILAQHIVNSNASQTENSNEVNLENEIPKKMSYDKYQVWRLKLHNESQLKALERYKTSSNNEGHKIQWLMGPNLRGLTDVAVPPKLLSNFQAFLKSETIAHEVLIFDFGKAILYEDSKEKLAPKPKRSNSLSWQRYHNYDEIVRFLESQQSKNHNFVELLHIGRSYEGRPLIVAKIAFRNANQIKKKKKTGNRNGILIEAGIHGREWIGPASATWIINELVKIMKSNQTTSETESIRKATWYIMPMLNPDGYTYSQEYDRMWKKSRSKNIVRADGILSTAMKWFQQNTPQKYCYGVDLDRNWDYEWSLKGSSKTPCNEFFAGYSAFSEPETKAFSKFLLDYRKEIKLFVSLHSYGQIISYPNKVRNSYVAQKLDDLLDVAMVGIDGLRKSGSITRYKIDSTNDMTISKSGSSDNFAMNVAGIPYSFTFNIGDNGVHGFLLPGSYIETTSRDTFVIIKSILDYIL